MTRTVFDNAMTAHVWAQQTQDSGQSHNGNFWFSGPTLYSYGRHYVVGHALPSSAEPSGFLFLLNDDSSTMTTNGKHKPAARRAVRGAPCYVPGLTRLVDVLAPRYGDAEPPTKAERAQRVRRVAAHLESARGAYFPGPEAAARILRALGCPEAEAARRGRAMAARVARAIEAHAAAEAREKLDSDAAMARGHFMRATPAETAAEARAKLAEAAGASRWQAERLTAEAAELGREAHRAAKAAKAKGWARIAARCRAHHKAVRAELARFEKDSARYALRAQLRADCKAVRGAAEQIRTFWAVNPEAAEGAPVADHGRAVRACETGAKGFAELAAALGRILESPYSRAMTRAHWVGLGRMADTADATATQLRTRAGQLRTEWQAEARAEWLAGGNPSAFAVGRLCDERGAALLRAEGVERDESGAITGGTLRTSWGATVPLAHAVRAFRFLRHCRDTATEWRANGRTLPVGHFRIEHVDSAGNFVAGCHRISWAECARVAGLLGLAELAGADTTESSHRAA